eukprot:15454226-Alexandrium_andersonii.AAC.1
MDYCFTDPRFRRGPQTATRLGPMAVAEPAELEMAALLGAAKAAEIYKVAGFPADPSTLLGALAVLDGGYTP